MLIAIEDDPLRIDALVAKAKRGDEAAFARLTRNELDGLYRVAWLILRDESDAGDALQDGLLRAWRDLASLRDPARLSAWLRRLVVNAAYDVARRRGRQRVRELPLAASNRSVPGPDQRAVDQDRLGTAFVALSAEHRAAVVLRYYLDLPPSEIAVSLGIPEGTVKSRLHYAIAALRASLEAAERSPQVDRARVRRDSP
jgi:RNA polymerase sigma-70 factor (ECF subfamily)